MNSNFSFRRTAVPGLALLALLALLLYPLRQAPAPAHAAGVAPNAPPLHLGYFPNVTHAPAVVGVARGEFQRALGRATALDPKVFNAGPEEMEALLAGAIDIGYVGPGPAIDTFVHSHGNALKVIAGACSGGAALVAREGAPITTLADLAGKKVAVPQLGGTQDISLRHFLKAQGLLPQEKGGTVQIIPAKNPDIFTLFKRGELDAAWVPEPWATRLILEAKAHQVVDERDLWPNRQFSTTVLVVRQDYLKQHPREVQAILLAHLKTVEWLTRNPKPAQEALNGELKRLAGKKLSDPVITAAWSHVTFTADLDRANLEAIVQASADAGYLRPNEVDIAQLLDTGPLRQAQKQVAHK